MKLHWGNAITIFFVIFLSLAFYFIYFAINQNNDLILDDYYEKGAEYTKQIYINERSIPFKDSIKINESNDSIEFYFCDSIINNSNTIFVNFYRPSNKQFDFTTKFNSNSKIFILSKSKLKKGRYIVKLSWKINTFDYEITRNVFVD